jgi:hypothetical protein
MLLREFSDVDAAELLDEIRTNAEIMAKGTTAARSSAHSAVRRLLDDFDQLEIDAQYEEAIVADRLKVVREQLTALATVGGTRAWELDQYWNWAKEAVNSLADAIGLEHR